ncbi:MAG: hypothetical protein ABGW85_00640, partial [Sulfurimonas sp.]
MRSGNGDNTQTFSISSIITLFILSSATLFADEYLISYRSVIQDAIVYNETLTVSHAMQKCSQSELLNNKALLLPLKKSKNLKTIILQNYEEFLEYLQKSGMKVEHFQETRNSINHATTRLTFQTHCFKV